MCDLGADDISGLRSRANMHHIRQSRPDSGLGFQIKVRHSLHIDPSELGSGSKTNALLSARGRQNDLSGVGAGNAASERRGHTLESYEDFELIVKVLTVLYVPKSPGS